VPIAGKYRLIDIPISNCLNSGLNRVYVLTQFLSVSLHRHITHTYKFDHFGAGFVELLAAQQTLDQSNWYQGTADAVRQNLRYVQEPQVEHVLILSGDQLYRMDFRRMLDTHLLMAADVTIATLPVPRSMVSSFGIMRLDDGGRVVDFVEKPKESELVDRFRTDPAWIDQHGVQSRGREHLASMGIYLFRRDVLVKLLDGTAHTDFGKEVFPGSIKTQHVQAHLFDGYWEDIGTIRSFWRANLELAADAPPFDLEAPSSPIYSRPRFLPPARLSTAHVDHSLIADGCTIGPGARIENSVIGLRCRIGSNVTIRNSVIMGADYYESPADLHQNSHSGQPAIGIGSGTVIENAIVDKNCRIGAGARVIDNRGVQNSDETPEAVVCDGVVVVPKEAILPNGWSL
jgi:glucose-1-phosphate adenylyltransferase